MVPSIITVTAINLNTINCIYNFDLPLDIWFKLIWFDFQFGSIHFILNFNSDQINSTSGLFLIDPSYKLT